LPRALHIDGGDQIGRLWNGLAASAELCVAHRLTACRTGLFASRVTVLKV
jgi:hypothetical protein